MLQVVCDITIAKESAVFRQVGPMMGSFDAGYGTWYLEDLVGKKRAKEMWYRNPKLTAREALEWGLINQVVPDAELEEFTRKIALEIAERGAFALASIKARVQRAPRRRQRPVAHGARHAAARLPRDGRARTNWRSPSRSAAGPTLRTSATEPAFARFAMSHLLTLHDPATARENYLSGVWQTDTLYSLARATRDRARHGVRAARRVAPPHLDARWSPGSTPWRRTCTKRACGGATAYRSGCPSRVESVVILLACSRNGYVCNPSLHQNYTVAEIVALLSRVDNAGRCSRSPGYGADADGATSSSRPRLAARYEARVCAGAGEAIRQSDRCPWRPAHCRPRRCTDRRFRPEPNPDKIVYLAFTSGTTGMPKGVMH